MSKLGKLQMSPPRSDSNFVEVKSKVGFPLNLNNYHANKFLFLKVHCRIQKIQSGQRSFA